MAELVLNEISLKYLELPKGIITNLGNSTYEVDVEALTDFHTSDRGERHFHDMEARLYDLQEEQFNKRKDMLGEKWVYAKTDEDRGKIKNAEEEVDLWFTEQCREIDAGIREGKLIYETLIKWVFEHYDGTPLASSKTRIILQTQANN